MLLGLAGCGKMNTGGEDTNFPYSWKEERRGTVLLKLDGSRSPEGYYWSIKSTDETVLEVKVVKKEKKGIITYRIKPLKEGSAQVVFARERDLTSTGEKESTSGEAATDSDEPENQASGTKDGMASAREEEIQLEDIKEQETDPSMEAEEASAAAMASENFEAYLSRFRAKDIIGEIEIRFDAEPVGKKGKLKLSLVLANTKEHKGIMQGGAQNESTDYQLWEDSDGSVRVRLPELEEAWSTSWNGNYEPVEDPGIPGIVVSVPEMRDGKYVILEIEDEGNLEGARCYTIRGLDQGTAMIEFSNPALDKALLVQIQISGNGRIEVLSHRMMAPQ
jgi:hypothetical protein